jgi:hypothetical protein
MSDLRKQTPRRPFAGFGKRAASGLLAVVGISALLLWPNSPLRGIRAQGDSRKNNSGPSASPQFLLSGNAGEIRLATTPPSVVPSVMPRDLKAALVLRGKGTVSFAPGGGVSFGVSGQQNRDVAYLQFHGKGVGALFDPRSPGEVSFTLTSAHDYAERQALVKGPPYRDFRVVFQVYQSLVQVAQFTVTAMYGKLSFTYSIGGKDEAYSFPAGREDALFGKGRAARIRMAWDGAGTGHMYVNGELSGTAQYNTRARLNWSEDSSFSIGATDQHNYGGGFYACDDIISDFKVVGVARSATELPKITLIAPTAGESVSGVVALAASADESVTPVAAVYYRLDGKDVAGPVYYPYRAYLNTRTVADGPRRLEVVARSAGGQEAMQTLELAVANQKAAAATDTIPPGPVSGLLADSISAGAIRFTWQPSTDNVGAVSYNVFRDGKLLASVPVAAPSAQRLVYRDAGLAPSTTYAYQVEAKDAAGNISPRSAPFELTTAAKDGKVRHVGPSGEYKTPCAALKDAHDWDTVEIDAAGSGAYGGDVCVIAASHLAIRGVNGRPHIEAQGRNAGGKAIWVVTGDDVTIENVELSGATVPDRNGAGVRLEGSGLTLRSVYFHDNQDGLLVASVARGVIRIEYSEFSYNGDGSGQTHNLYVGAGDQLIFRYNYSHHALGGQLLKTRAKQNFVAYNRLTDETGQASYEMDYSNGGAVYAVGNVIQQSAFGENDAFVAYAREKFRPGYAPQLYMVNNTFVNLARTGRLLAANSGSEVLFQNNLISGPGAVPESGGGVKVTSSGNEAAAFSVFPRGGRFDYRPAAGSAAARPQSAPAALGNGVSLAPLFEYFHPTSGVVRPDSNRPNAGALSAR